MRVDAAPGDDVVALIRAATGESVVVVIAPGRTLLDLAQTRAAIAPLAIERAPMRVNAVEPAPKVDPRDVDAAVAFLDVARSTTGQLLAIVARD